MKFYTFVLFCIASCIGFSQNCNLTIKGTVQDFHNGASIENANILIKNSKKYAVSNGKGEFAIKGLCQGKVTLVISHISCTTIEKTIDLNQDYNGKFVLEHHTRELEQVTVVGKSIVKKTKSLSETVLTKEIVESYSSASLGDALKVVPGVSSINTGNAIVKPMINGMHSSRIIVMNNGVRLQDQEWGVEHAPNVDINSANSISVVKGAGALAFGSDAIGGVVIMSPGNPIRKDSLFGKAITGFQSNGRGYHASTFLSRTYESGLFINGNISYKRFGDYSAADYLLTNTGSESYASSFEIGKKTFEKGWSFLVSHVSNEIGILRGAHVGNRDDLNEAISSPRPLIIEPFSYDIDEPRQDVEHWIAKVNYFRRFENLGKLMLQYDYQNNRRFEFDRRIGGRRSIPAVDLRLQTHSVTSDFVFDALDNWKIQSGLLFRYQDNFANPDTGVRRIIPDYDRIDLGIYTTAVHRLNDFLELDLGVRYDFNYYNVKKFYRISRWEALGYDALFSDLIIRQEASQYLTNPVLDFHNYALSAGLKWEVSDKSDLLFNYTLATRPPNVAELFSDGLHHSAARIELGDLRIDPEQSHRFSASYLGETKNLKWQLEGYMNSIQDYIYLVPTGDQQTIRGAFPVWSYLQTNAFLFGFDVWGELSLSDHWSYRLNSSYIYAQDLENKEGIIDIPPFQLRNQISYTNSELNNFSSTLVSEFVGRQNRFPVALLQLSEPPAAFHLIHFQNSIDLNWFKKAKLQLSFNINNLLNTSYRDYLNRLRFFADELGRNFQIQVNINF